MVKKEIITKDMNISDIVSKYPDAVEVLFQHGLHCIGCMAAQFENLEEASRAHGIDLKKLLADLNKKVSGK